MNNSLVTTGSVILVSVSEASENYSAAFPSVWADNVAAGSFRILLTNIGTAAMNVNQTFGISMLVV